MPRKPRLYKKGDEAQFLWVALAIVVIFILFSMFSIFTKSVDNPFNRELCQKQVMLNSNLAIRVSDVALDVDDLVGEQAFIPLPACHYYEYTFMDDKVEIFDLNEGKKFEYKPLAGKKRMAKEDIFYYMAVEMTLCHFQFFQGESDVFNDQWMGAKAFNQKLRCFKCGTFRFDEKLIDRLKKDGIAQVSTSEELNGKYVLKGFFEYLKNSPKKKIPYLPLAEDENFYHYVFEKEPEYMACSYLPMIDENIEFELSPYKSYTVVFSKNIYPTKFKWAEYYRKLKQCLIDMSYQKKPDVFEIFFLGEDEAVEFAQDTKETSFYFTSIMESTRLLDKNDDSAGHRYCSVFVG